MIIWQIKKNSSKSQIALDKFISKSNPIFWEKLALLATNKKWFEITMIC